MFSVPCHWLIVDKFGHPTPMKTAVQLYSRKGLKCSRWVVVPCHWLIVDKFEHPTPMKIALQLYSRKGLKYSKLGFKRRLWELVISDVDQLIFVKLTMDKLILANLTMDKVISVKPMLIKLITAKLTKKTI